MHIVSRYIFYKTLKEKLDKDRFDYVELSIWELQDVIYRVKEKLGLLDKYTRDYDKLDDIRADIRLILRELESTVGCIILRRRKRQGLFVIINGPTCKEKAKKRVELVLEEMEKLASMKDSHAGAVIRRVKEAIDNTL